MSKIIDNICKLRDLLENKDIYFISRKLGFYRGIIQAIFDEVHRNLAKRTLEYEQSDEVKHELDFTSQDLRELAQDIRNVFKKWENEMNPEKNIKALLKTVKNGKLDTRPFTETKTKIMAARRDYMQPLMELLNLIEYHSVFLYMLEIASNDEFAIKYTERLNH